MRRVAFKKCFANAMTLAFYSRKNRAALVCGAVACALWALVVRVWINNDSARVAYGLSFSPMTTLGFVAEVFVPAQSTALACDLFTEPRRTGLFARFRAAGVSETRAYFSGYLASLAFCFAGVAALYFVSAVLSLLFPGSQERRTLLAYAVTLAPACVSLALATLCANAFSSSFAAAACFFTAYIGLKALGSFFALAADASFTSYMQWHILWTGAELPVGRVANVAGLLLATGSAFLAVGYLAFTGRGRA